MALLKRHFGVVGAPAADAGPNVRAASIRIVNDGASASVAASVVLALRRAGDADVRLVQAPGGPPQTTVLLSDGSPAPLRAVRRQLGYGQTRLSGEGVLGADMTIWLGTDAQVPQVVQSIGGGGAGERTVPGT